MGYGTLKTMELTYKELADTLSKKVIKKLFEGGHPSSGVVYNIEGFDIEWNAEKGIFYLGTRKEIVKFIFDDLKSERSATRKKTRLENEGYTLCDTICGFTQAELIYKK